MQYKGWEVLVESENAVESVSISTAHYSEEFTERYCDNEWTKASCGRKPTENTWSRLMVKADGSSG